MSFSSYLVGVVYFGALIAGLIWVATRLRSLLVPGWSGAPARLAEVVLGSSMLTIAAEVAGSIDGFTRIGLLAALAACVGATVLLERRTAVADAARESVPEDATSVASRLPTFAVVASFAIVAAVLLQWMTWTVFAVRFGISDFDSLNYHLPFATRFVQDGSITSLVFVSADPLHAYHPAGIELFHGATMLVDRTEFLVPVLSFGFLCLGLLAGWCAGRPFGVAPLCLAATAIVFALPGVGSLQAGSARTDAASAAFFLAAVAIALSGTNRRTAFLGGLAAGLGVAAKLTVLGPAVALFLVLAVVSWREEGRAGLWTRMAPWIGGFAITGLYWMARNTIETGSPIPSLDLGILPHPDTPLLDAAGYSIAHYFDQPDLLGDVILEGWRIAVGPGWWLVGALLIGGLVLATIRGRGLARWLVPLALAAGLVYLTTPATALGLEGEPRIEFVAFNLRYAIPALAVALIAGSIALANERSWVQSAAAAVLAVAAALTLSADGELVAWADITTGQLAVSILATVGVCALLLALRLPAAARFAAAAPLIAAAALIVALVAVWPSQRNLSERQATTGVQTETAIAAAWARSVDDASIGAVGFLELYALTGERLENRVTYIVEDRPHGGAGPLRTCADLRRAINAAGFEFVVVGPVDPNQVVGTAENDRDEVAQEWVADSDSATVVVDEPGLTIVGLDGPLDPEECARTAGASA